MNIIKHNEYVYPCKIITCVADPLKSSWAIERPLRSRLVSFTGIFIKKNPRRAEKLVINVLRRKYEAEKIIFY